MKSTPPRYLPVPMSLVQQEQLPAGLLLTLLRLYAQAWRHNFSHTDRLDFKTQLVPLLGLNPNYLRAQLTLLRRSGWLDWYTDSRQGYTFTFPRATEWHSAGVEADSGRSEADSAGAESHSGFPDVRAGLRNRAAKISGKEAEVSGAQADFPAPVADYLHTHPPPRRRRADYSDTSPGISDTSPGISDTSPGISDTSPDFSDASPEFSDASPDFSDTSPDFSGASPDFSDTSPGFSGRARGLKDSDGGGGLYLDPLIKNQDQYTPPPLTPPPLNHARAKKKPRGDTQVLRFLLGAGVYSDRAIRLASRIHANEQRPYNTYLPTRGDILGWIVYAYPNGKTNRITNPGALIYANLSHDRRCPAELRPPVLCWDCHCEVDYCTCETESGERPKNTRLYIPEEFLEYAFKPEHYTYHQDAWRVCQTCHAYPCQCDELLEDDDDS
jgi:hypothetical protein